MDGLATGMSDIALWSGKTATGAIAWRWQRVSDGMRVVDGQAGDTIGLVRGAQAGDALAFEKLLELHYLFIYKTAYRWLGHKSDAEDVTQSVCMRLGQALQGFDGRSAFTSWLYRVTLNAVRDWQRSQTRQKRQVAAVSAVTSDDIAPDQEDGLLVHDIWRQVRELPEKQRDAVLLVYGEELSHAEAGKIMDCKEVTVSWHIHNARKALRTML